MAVVAAGGLGFFLFGLSYVIHIPSDYENRLALSRGPRCSRSAHVNCVAIVGGLVTDVASDGGDGGTITVDISGQFIRCRRLAHLPSLETGWLRPAEGPGE